MSRTGVIAAVSAAFLVLASVASGASFTLTTTNLGTGSVSTPVMFPDSLNSANVGPNVGKIDKNDTLTFVWSRVINQPTLCSGWSNAQSTHTLNMTWVIQDNAGSTGDDVLVPSTTGATCSSGMHVGSIDLGASNYINNNQNGTFANSPTTITVGATTTSLVWKVPGAPTGGKAGTVTTGSAAVWTPDSAVTDMAGNNCGANLAATSETVLF